LTSSTTSGASALRVAIVTGAGSGIGRAVALALLGAGYAVALAGRRVELLQQVADASGAAERALVVPCDVGDEQAVAALFSATVKAWGRLDLLFNNAGINAPGVLLEDLSLADWRRVVDTNLTGMFLCVREAFRVMKAQQPQGGRIINNGSISAHTPRPFTSPYTASKHAVLGLTKSIALDGREFNIVCSQIDIGNALTELSERMTRGVRQANGSMAAEPMMDVQHVAEAVRYVAGLPLATNVLNMTVMASHMPFVGRG